MDKIDAIDAVDKLTDLVLLSILILQEVSGMTNEEVIERIKSAGDRSNELKAKLRKV